MIRCLGQDPVNHNVTYLCRCECGREGRVFASRLGINKHGCRPCAYKKQQHFPDKFCFVCGKKLSRAARYRPETTTCRKCCAGNTKFSPSLSEMAEAGGVCKQAVSLYIKKRGFSAAVERYMPEESA